MQSMVLNRTSPRSELAELNDLLPPVPTHPVRLFDSAHDLRQPQTPRVLTRRPSTSEALLKPEEALEADAPSARVEVLERFAVAMQKKYQLTEKQVDRLQAAYNIVAKHPVNADLVQQIALTIAGRDTLDIHLLTSHIAGSGDAVEILKIAESREPNSTPPAALTAQELSAAAGFVLASEQSYRKLDRVARAAEERLRQYRGIDAMSRDELVRGYAKVQKKSRETLLFASFCAVSVLFSGFTTGNMRRYFRETHRKKRLKRALTSPGEHAAKVANVTAEAKVARARANAAKVHVG